MFKNKSDNNSNNLCGKNVYIARKNLGLSQRALADKLQILELDVGKNAIQRIESGERFVTDIELKVLSQALNVDINWLLDIDNQTS